MSKAILYDRTLFIGCKACEGGCAGRWGLPYNDKVAAEERIPAHKPTVACPRCANVTCAMSGRSTVAVPTLRIREWKVRMSPGALYAGVAAVL